MPGQPKNYHRRVGRSIEEILVHRKLDGTDPSSWPDPAKPRDIRLSNSLPALPRDNSNEGGGKTEPTLRYSHSSEQSRKPKTQNELDNEQVIESLKEYCSSLQNRVKVSWSIFNRN